MESLLALRRRRRKRRWMVRRRLRVPRQLHGLVRRGAPWTLHARAARGRIKPLTEADEKEESEADAEEEIRCTTVPMQCCRVHAPFFARKTQVVNYRQG